ncbi:phage tail sheath family protein [Methylomonas sp. HW2-6]|uniref:phage tail sheath family protein n=1 Tax=Methylomonas sp. HW2-6 TaxID=3376687 RepID=UPI00404205E7
MATYLTPGVYIEELSTGSNSIEMVGSEVAAFLGVAPAVNKHLNEAFACNNWQQFVREFTAEDSESTDLARSVYAFFCNGGSRCYVVNVGKGGSVVGDARKRTGLYCLEPIDEIAIVAAPGYTDKTTQEALKTFCENRQDVVAILDASRDAEKNIDALKQIGSEEASDAAAKPADAPTVKGLLPSGSDRGFTALYFPWVVAADPLNPIQKVATPPSGFMAGIYAKTDVHKAPANQVLNGALGLTYMLTHQEQGELNRLGVNCIRSFPTSGIRVWGARTLSSRSEWRYVNVRRLFNSVEESLAKGTLWTVFEPNERILWNSVVRNVSAFLTRLWRSGALKGATPEQAFFVKCDAETNPQEVIDAGQLIIEIGIAPVKPAEFIIFRIGQWAGATPVEPQNAA